MTDSPDSKRMKTYAYIDLDGFSEINNEHGHSFGDEVLEQIEEFGHNFVEDKGEFIREYGQGDEFLMEFSDLDKARSEELMEDFRQQLERLEPNGVTVTASIGIASVPEDGEDREDVIDEADQAMLNAETWGGNCVRVSGREIPTEEFEVWFEDILPIDEDDYILIEMWLDELPEIRAGEIYNESKDLSNTNPNTNAIMSSTKHRQPIPGVVTEILNMSSKETRFKMVAERSRLKEIDLL